MRLLLDSHALVWWLSGDGRLPDQVRDVLKPRANDVYVSAASAWEIVTKHRLGKLPSSAALASDFIGTMARENLISLPVTMPHAVRAGGLARAHKDPFDRMLIAQALVEKLTFISNEETFDAFGVNRLW